MSSVKDYPAGRAAPVKTFINDVYVEFLVDKVVRTRVTLIQLNAGLVLLPNLPRVCWQILDWTLIAIGGAATAGTSVDITGTRAGALVRPGVTAIAALTRSAVVRAGAANAVVLADGASFTPLDVNTGVSIINVGAPMTTLTHVDVILNYMATAP